MKYRVVQWATGAMGKACLQAILDHPAMELVGLFTYGAEKAGKDAGTLMHRPAVGITATSDVDEILALDADVVVHCARILPPYGYHDDEIVKLLKSGKNVITINGYSRPEHWSDQRTAALKAACEEGGVTLMAGGLNPGFAGEQLAVMASGICSAVEGIEVTENVDCRIVRNPQYVFDSLGFGTDPGEVNPNDPDWGPASIMNGMYSETIAAMAHHLRADLESIETEHRVFPATRELTIAAGVIPKGRVSHTHWKWHGIIGGARRLTMSINWYMETAHLDDPDPSLWALRIAGRPGVSIDVDVSKATSEVSRLGPEQLAVAGAVVNSIPVVCEADPGMLTRPIATPFRVDLSGWGTAAAA